MIICVCQNVSTDDIEATIRDGCKSFEEFCEMRMIDGNCRACLPTVKECFEKLMSDSQ